MDGSVMLFFVGLFLLLWLPAGIALRRALMRRTPCGKVWLIPALIPVALVCSMGAWRGDPVEVFFFHAGPLGMGIVAVVSVMLRNRRGKSR